MKYLLTLLLLLNIGYSQIVNLINNPTECINYQIPVTGCIKINIPDNNYGGLLQVYGDSQSVTFRVDSANQTIVFDTLGVIGWSPMSSDKIFKHSCCWYNYTLEVCGIYNSTVQLFIEEDIQFNLPILNQRLDICPNYINDPIEVDGLYIELPIFKYVNELKSNTKYKKL